MTQPETAAQHPQHPQHVQHLQHPHRESPVRRILIESALIAVSILLALAANQWNDARKQRTLTERSLHAVSDEIKGNAARVHAVLDYHRGLETAAHTADTSNHVHSLADWGHAVPIWSGFAAPEYDATAWQTAITLGAVSNMGFDTVQTLARLYTLQGKIDQYNSGAIQTFDFSDVAMHSTVRRIYVYVATMRTLEDTLLNRYALSLKLLTPASPVSSRGTK
jgi:hypothetical protein